VFVRKKRKLKSRERERVNTHVVKCVRGKDRVDGWRKASARANALITKRHLTGVLVWKGQMLGGIILCVACLTINFHQLTNKT
jgi:hypothetical protein